MVLTDRYVYSIIARSTVRGIDPDWLRDLYRFAPVAHGVFYLKVDITHLVPRVLAGGGFDFWESGIDFRHEPDLFSSFVPYQRALLGVFDDLAETHGFEVLDANRGIGEIFADLREGVSRILAGTKGRRPRRTHFVRENGLVGYTATRPASSPLGVRRAVVFRRWTSLWSSPDAARKKTRSTFTSFVSLRCGPWPRYVFFGRSAMRS